MRLLLYTLVLVFMATSTLGTDLATEDLPPPAAASGEEHSVLFQPAGYCAYDTHYLNIRLPIPLRPIFDSIINTKHLIETKDSYYFQEPVEKIQLDARAAIASIESNFENVLATMPQHQVNPSTREARFLDLLGGGLGISGIALGVFNTVKLQGMDAQISKLDEELTLLKDITQIHDNHLKNLDQRVELHNQMFSELQDNNPAEYQSLYHTAITHIKKSTRLVTSAISHAQRHRLAPGVFSSESLEAVVDHTEQVAKDNNYLNFVHHTSDLFQLETSFLYNPVEHVFIIILHIPMVKREHLLTMYKYEPQPLATHLAENSSLVPDVGQDDIIAVMGLEAYKVMSSSDLLDCLKFGNHHFCGGGNALRTNFKSTCLGSIFMGDFESSRTQCNFWIQRKKETLLDLGNNQFRVYTMANYTTEEVCENGNRAVNVSNGVTLEVRDGCRIQLQQNLLIANVQQEMELETENRILSWTWNITHVFPNSTPNLVEEALNSLTARGFHNVDASDLLHQLDLIAAKPSSEFYTTNYTAPLASVALAVVILGAAVLFCCCKKQCCNKKVSPQIMPTVNVHVDAPRTPAAPTSNFSYRPSTQPSEEPQLFKYCDRV
jgi:hypothetical protein